MSEVRKTTLKDLQYWHKEISRMAFTTKTKVAVELRAVDGDPDVAVTFYDKSNSNYTINLYEFQTYAKNKEFVVLAERIIDQKVSFADGRKTHTKLRGF